jgi:hypothetical protein
MLTTRATALDVGCGARECSPPRSIVATRREFATCGLRHDTPLRGWGKTRWSALHSGVALARLHNSTRVSLSIANCGRRGRLIREKIIGHGLHSLTTPIAVYRCFFHRGVLALAHQPARQQRRCIFFQPGIQQLGDLLTEIGGVVQAREFVALQGIAGSGEQELPGGLSFVIQGNLRKRSHPINISQTNNSTKYVRSVEKCAKFCLGWRASGAIRTTPRAKP